MSGQLEVKVAFLCDRKHDVFGVALLAQASAKSWYCGDSDIVGVWQWLLGSGELATLTDRLVISQSLVS